MQEHETRPQSTTIPQGCCVSSTQLPSSNYRPAMSWNIKVHSTDLSVLVYRLWGKQAQAQSFRKQMVWAHTNTHAHDAHTHTCTHTILRAHYDWTVRKHRGRGPASPERWHSWGPSGAEARSSSTSQSQNPGEGEEQGGNEWEPGKRQGTQEGRATSAEPAAQGTCWPGADLSASWTTGGWGRPWR